MSDALPELQDVDQKRLASALSKLKRRSWKLRMHRMPFYVSPASHTHHRRRVHIGCGHVTSTALVTRTQKTWLYRLLRWPSLNLSSKTQNRPG